MRKPKISIIIVTYNSQKTIKKCLDSIIRFSFGVEILVFDNDSRDQTKEIVGGYGKKLTLIKSSKNLGFAKANNLAVNKASGEYLVFLNPDTELIKKNTLEQLVEVLVKNPQFGLVGPKIEFPDGSLQKTVRHLPTVFRAFKQYVLGIKDSYDFYIPQCADLCDVESVVGACIVIRKDVFIKAGKFNEKYFMYFEDLELCEKVKRVKFKVGYDPNVVVRHTVGASGERAPVSQYFLSSAKKYHGTINFFLIELILFPTRIFNKIRSFCHKAAMYPSHE